MPVVKVGRIAMAALLAAATLSAAQVGRIAAPTLPDASDADSTYAQGATTRDVVYGVVGKEKLKLDVYSPKPKPAAPVPGILLIHGGSWQVGDKSWMAFAGRELAKHGYVAFSINYRLHDGRKNRWPAQLDDAQRAVRWVRAHAADYGVDANRIGALGHSAGAQMASLLGELDTRDNSDTAPAKYSSRVQAIVDISGPVDFTQNHDPDGDAMLADLLGATEAQDPQLWKDASPVFNIHKDTAPFLIVHGTRDGMVPIAQAVEFANALQRAGMDVTLVQVDDGHDMDNNRARLGIEAVRFFDRVLGPAPVRHERQ